MIKKSLLHLIFTLQMFFVYGQVYFPDDSQVVNQRIEEWRNLKFGLFMHWGTYSQWGIIESWSLHPPDAYLRTGPYANNYFEYKKAYEDLQKSFNPTGFEPEKWAIAAKNAGMKYVVFTTKHHDGFCMFDTKETTYKITDPSCPFSNSEKADVTKAIFESFRRHGFWAGAYFSLADWNSDYFWWRKFPMCHANVNYNINEYPERWQKFTEYTHNQIIELMKNYKGLDILWLDGNWARDDGDLKLDTLVKKIREIKNDVIVVDRGSKTKRENYLTAENFVPNETILYPWEVCLCSGGGWSHTPNAVYKTGREGVHLLIDVVSKGGNLLLNIAPGPDGKWQQGAYGLLEAYGDWMKINSEGIYNTRAFAPYREEKICITRKNTGFVYFFYLADEGEDHMPAEILIKSHQPASGANVSLLGYNGKLKWQKEGEGFKVFIPEKVRENPPCAYAWTIKVSEITPMHVQKN